MANRFEPVEFRCPPVVSPDAPDDFCTPEELCPDRQEMFKFPSPNSCLPEEVLEALELRIEAANEFLLDLALSNRRDRNEVFHTVFEKLLGREVKVFLECASVEQNNAEVRPTIANNEAEQAEKNVVTGFVHLAGRDFSILKNENKLLLLPHRQIGKIELLNRFTIPHDPPSLNNIDPCLRRCLTFRFGEVVSGSPELIQIFFGLDLRMFLLLSIGKRIKLILEDEAMEGAIFDADGETLVICENENRRTIPLDRVCSIVVKED